MPPGKSHRKEGCGADQLTADRAAAEARLHLPQPKPLRGNHLWGKSLRNTESALSAVVVTASPLVLYTHVCVTLEVEPFALPLVSRGQTNFSLPVGENYRLVVRQYRFGAWYLQIFLRHVFGLL